MKSFDHVNDRVIQELMKEAAKRDPADYEFLPDGEIRHRMGDAWHCINVDRRWEIVSDLPITSHRRRSGKLIVWCKQKTKKFFQWYVDALFDQQVEFNHTMWAAYYQQKKELEALRREVAALKEEKQS